MLHEVKTLLLFKVNFFPNLKFGRHYRYTTHILFILMPLKFYTLNIFLLLFSLYLPLGFFSVFLTLSFSHPLTNYIDTLFLPLFADRYSSSSPLFSLSISLATSLFIFLFFSIPMPRNSIWALLSKWAALLANFLYSLILWSVQLISYF